MLKYLTVLLITVFSSSPALAQAQEWTSQNSKTDVIELYTSEGCSSCPPAERWLSGLAHQRGLFRSFIPMAFHVDYWDWLGWQDRFANAGYSMRQRRYMQEDLLSQVYTPGLMVNSQEWRAWFNGARQWEPANEPAGVLSATLRQNQLKVSYAAEKQNYKLTVAILGMGITSSVNAGENKGKQLVHDFVVLQLVGSEGNGDWDLKLPGIPDAGQQQSAIAIWVTHENSQRILQAVGGFL